MENLNTFEMMLSVPMDRKFMREMLKHLWAHENEKIKEFINCLVNKEGRLLDILIRICAGIPMA